MRLFRVTVMLAAACLFVFAPRISVALDVSVSAIVHEQIPPEITPATIVFNGYAYPNASIRILKDSVQVATVTAGSNAQFSATVTTDPGSYTFGVIGRDQTGKDGVITNVAMTVTSGSTTTVSNVFLGPTINQDKTSIRPDQSVVFSGYSVPGSAVALTVESDPVTYPATANASGQWSVTVPGSAHGLGTHTAKATATTGSVTSSLSDILSFLIEGQLPNICDGKVSADINCDGKVNLVDFSILMFFWQQTNPSNARADINADTKVDETDFSILLFYWTG